MLERPGRTVDRPIVAARGVVYAVLGEVVPIAL